MTEYSYDEADYVAAGEDARGARIQNLVNLSGALVSLALIGGMAVWGYKLLVRDVSGIPVIEAIEGAFRVAPDDPGGDVAPNQGLQVNEIAALGSAGEMADELRLAPAGVDLTDEDLPGDALAALDPPEPVETPQAPVAAEADADDAAVPMLRVLTPDIATLEALTGQEAEAPLSLEDAPEDALSTDLAVAEALMQEAPTSATSLFPEEEGLGTTTSSVRPEPRPRAPRVDAVATVSADPAAQIAPAAASVSSVAEVSPDALVPGTRLVQLGAYGSEDVAREEWDRIGGRFAEYFEGKRRVVQRSVSGGKTFFRLRVEGFADLADARRFCSTLMAGRVECIPVEVK
ncbi:SPOR domain-containing protein [Palleronia sediminis]|uniref:SPOR domain-containing protein n=1 Tax=Palleronia sediminis TaxID=2547833 RepID=UPI001F113792|nr:SPOR domain-containing protein [Palleronia sediminis]